MSEKLKYSIGIAGLITAAFIYFFGYYIQGVCCALVAIGFLAAAIMHGGPPYDDENF